MCERGVPEYQGNVWSAGKYDHVREVVFCALKVFGNALNTARAEVRIFWNCLYDAQKANDRCLAGLLPHSFRALKEWERPKRAPALPHLRECEL